MWLIVSVVGWLMSLKVLGFFSVMVLGIGSFMVVLKNLL